jgi:hypothetical protein
MRYGRKLIVLPVAALSLGAAVLLSQGALVAVPAPEAAPTQPAQVAATEAVTVANWEETGITRPRPGGSQTNPTISPVQPPR